MNRRGIGLLLLLMTSLLSCLKDGAFKAPFDGYVPREIGDGLSLSDPQTEGMDEAVLKKAFELVYSDDRFLMARSLLVFRHGKLVAEAYPDDVDDIHVARNIQSCTKTVTSLVLGAAIQDGYLEDLNTPLYDLIPAQFDADERKRHMSVEDALTMRSGLEFDNGVHTLSLYQTTENSAQYVLSQDYLYPAGTFMNYNDGAPQLISVALEELTGLPMDAYADERLFGPLGIDEWQWEHANDGSAFGAFSLYLRPRDLGQIGQLLLNGGRWGADTLIDSAYLSQAVSIQTAANFHGEPYGYYFWILPGLDGYAALGHGGQFLYVAPELDLVAVYTAWPYTSGAYFDQHTDLMSLIRESCN